MYLWIKSFHVISMVAWMAAMFYLPRLFVYHAGVPADSPQAQTFVVMERRLTRAIMNPAMIATWVFGITLVALQPAWLHQGWLHAKLLLVLGLSGLHGALSAWRRALAEGRNTKSARFFRIINEVPTLALIAIVILVIVKPF